MSNILERQPDYFLSLRAKVRKIRILGLGTKFQEKKSRAFAEVENAGVPN